MDDINISEFVTPGHVKVAWFRGNPFPLPIGSFNPLQVKNITYYLGSAFRLVWNQQWRIHGFEYITDPQRPSDVDEMLRPGETGSLLIRYGSPATQDWGVGDHINVVRVKLGERFVTANRDDEFALCVYRQDIRVLHAPDHVSILRQARAAA